MPHARWLLECNWRRSIGRLIVVVLVRQQGNIIFWSDFLKWVFPCVSLLNRRCDNTCKFRDWAVTHSQFIIAIYTTRVSPRRSGLMPKPIILSGPATPNITIHKYYFVATKTSRIVFRWLVLSGGFFFFSDTHIHTLAHIIVSHRIHTHIAIPARICVKARVNVFVSLSFAVFYGQGKIENRQKWYDSVSLQLFINIAITFVLASYAAVDAGLHPIPKEYLPSCLQRSIEYASLPLYKLKTVYICTANRSNVSSTHRPFNINQNRRYSQLIQKPKDLLVRNIDMNFVIFR